MEQVHQSTRTVVACAHFVGVHCALQCARRGEEFARTFLPLEKVPVLRHDVFGSELVGSEVWSL
jgi:hypothetical protein